MYFDSYDCASFVIRGLNQLYSFGATLLPDVHLNYTRINLYSNEPELLGTYDQIVANKTLHDDYILFYEEFQSKKPSTEDWVKSIIEIYETFYLSRRFYFYYNNEYWYLKLKENTPLGVTFDEIPITDLIKKK
jgi:ceroid-lipofuscinosis neuronal protein 5